MSSSIKDLFDYDLVKKCSKCEVISLKSNFHKHKTTKDGHRPDCKSCTTRYHREYMKNRRETDFNFRLIENTRRRIHHALNGETKSLATKEILGIDIETYKKWIEFQMTENMNWMNIHIDHVKPISSFDVSNDDELKEAFNWKNTQPLLKEDKLRKGSKFDFLHYRLQFIKAYEFLRLNDQEERPN